MKTLYLANKRYSSWSLRAWLVLSHFEIPFREVVIPLRRADTARQIDRIAPGAKLPILVEGPVKIWESLAILEYLAESHPKKHLWPKNTADRALARAVSNEMHASFMGLRQSCPMNCFASPMAVIPEPARADAARIQQLWKQCLARRRKGGFLLGAFSIADAMYAPVVIRFTTYGFPLEKPLDAYARRVLALPAMRAWFAGAAREKERIEAYEKR